MVLDVDKEPMLSREEKLKLIRQHIKYVFVLFQENRSFDFYFGTYPGADGLYSKPKDQIAGFTQPIVNLDGTVGTMSPFRIPDEYYGCERQDGSDISDGHGFDESQSSGDCS